MLQNETPGAIGLPGIYITFTLGSDEHGVHLCDQFAVRASSIRKIIGMQGMNEPRACVPKYIKGALPLRGQMIPIVDLRHKMFDVPQKITQDISIVIVENGTGSLTGVIVGNDCEATTITAAHILAEAPTGGFLEEHLLGLAIVNSRIIGLLNNESFLSKADQKYLTQPVH
jgi:purine-binding chemotaxis protein CheW